MIWLSTVWDSHSTQLQGPTGRFDGQFIKLKICFQPGVIDNSLHRAVQCIMLQNIIENLCI